MKKFLLCSLSALFILSTLFTVSASKEVNGWIIPDGFHLDQGGIISPVTADVGADGTVSVANGGWYTDGSTWGGIASAKKYTLDGLKVEVQFSKVSQEGDRWICIGFLEKPDIFKVKDIGSNKGYANLIRPKDKTDNSALNWQGFEAISSFSPGSAPVNTIFADNMKLTMEVKKDGANYKFILNGVESPAYANLASVFVNDAAHIVVAASGQNAIDKDYAYTVKVTGKIAPDAPATSTPTTTTPSTTTTTPAKDTTKQDVTKADTDKEDTAVKDNDKTTKDDTAKADTKSTEDVADVDTGMSGGMIAIIIIVGVVIIGIIVALIAKKKKK